MSIKKKLLYLYALIIPFMALLAILGYTKLTLEVDLLWVTTGFTAILIYLFKDINI
jgi:hypothetical protein